MADFRTWRNSERTWLKDVLPLDTPYNLYIETSSLCNARCVYCTQSKNPHGELMPQEIFDKIMDDSNKFPHKIKLFDLFYSGEPLCNPNFENMAAIAKRSGLSEKIGVTTNGLLLTPKRIDQMIEAGIDEIRISLQGLDAEAYKKICGVNIDFVKFYNNIRYLYKNRGKSKLRLKIPDIALKGIVDGRQKFEEMFGSVADSIFVENIIPIYDNVQYEELDEHIEGNKNNGRYGMKQLKINKVCYRPFIKMLVASNGDVTAACCNHPAKDVVFGNIQKEHLCDIWNGTKRYNFLKMQLKGKRFEHPFCKDCSIPNDVAYKEDLIDPYIDEILERF